jgi:hypothetical protein
MPPFKHLADEELLVLEVVKESRGPLDKEVVVELGRKFFTHWHCGRRMVQVKVFISGARGFDEVLCPTCLHHYTLVSTSYNASDS